MIMFILINLIIQITLYLTYQFHSNDWMSYLALFVVILLKWLFPIDACSHNLLLHSFHVLSIFHNFNEVFYFHFLDLYFIFHIPTFFYDLHLCLFLLFAIDPLPIFNFLQPIWSSIQETRFIKPMILTLQLMMFRFLDISNQLKSDNL